MKVIYLHQYFVTPGMPGGTRSFEMGRRLVQAGHEVEMITADTRAGASSSRWYITREEGIRVHWLPTPYSNNMGFRERLSAFFRFAYRARAKTVSLAGDVVFASSTPLTIAIPAVYAARRNGIPMVFEVRDLWPEVPIALGVLRNPVLRWVARRLERYAYENAAHIIALSEGMKSGIVNGGVPPEKVTVVPNSCDLDRFAVGAEQGRRIRSAHTWLGNRPLVLYAGALGRVNGVEYIVGLAKVARRLMPELRFAILGTGVEERLVRTAATRCEVLDRNLFMLGERPKNEMPSWFSASSLCMSVVIDRSELWNCSPNKVFDAMAAGRPIAINHGGWLADLIRVNGAGVVLPPHDLERAADVLVEFLGSQDKLVGASAASAQLAVREFSRNSLYSRLEGVLSLVTDRSARNFGCPEDASCRTVQPTRDK